MLSMRSALNAPMRAMRSSEAPPPAVHSRGLRPCWYRGHARITTPTAREITVARAAPAAPMRGKGPMPKMSSGSSPTLITEATPRAHIGVMASPKPRAPRSASS